MTKKPTTLDDLFGEFEAEQAGQAAKEDDAATVARREKKRREEIEREIRQGLRDANGDWIEQPEADEEVDEEDQEDGEGEDAGD